MQLCFFQHVPFENGANIIRWADEHGHAHHTVHLYNGDAPPAPDSYDLLVVLGGPMNIYDEADHPWLPAEKRAIRAAIDAHKRVLGICLGAQLIADVLGAEVTRAAHKERGFLDVELTGEGAEHPLFAGFPRHFPAFHWHDDTFAIPPGAVHAASSEGCAHQAFVHGDHVVGLQFHLETTGDAMENLITHSTDEITEGPFVHSPEIMREDSGLILDIRPLCFTLLDNLAK